jgi:hypothetical protein
VATLVPGVTTQTTTARYFSLYWALAEFADQLGYDAATCRALIRKAEVALAWASLVDPDTGELTGPGDMHAADSVARLLRQGREQSLTVTGLGTYSTRSWGYWSQYKGSSVVLQIASADRNAVRRGSRHCPQSISKMFEPLLQLSASRPPTSGDLAGFTHLTEMNVDSADVGPLRELMTATRQGSHRPEDWLASDQMRRSTLRILARATQLCPGTKGWRLTLSDAVAYGTYIDDPVLVEERRQAEAWRGMLLRHHSVGAWRILWASLVDEVLRRPDPVSRTELHDWVRAHVGSGTLAAFVDSLPPVSETGHPVAAEDQVGSQYERIEAAIAVLLLGAHRIDHLAGESLKAFCGGSASRRLYLDPYWVASQLVEYKSRTLGDFACALVDDMLAQSHRVSLRKMRVEGNGRMVLPTKLHEREGRYFADSAEGSGNVGVRAYELGQMCTQLGIFAEVDGIPEATDIGRDLLSLPR